MILSIDEQLLLYNSIQTNELNLNIQFECSNQENAKVVIISEYWETFVDQLKEQSNLNHFTPSSLSNYTRVLKKWDIMELETSKQYEYLNVMRYNYITKQ